MRHNLPLHFPVTVPMHYPVLLLVVCAWMPGQARAQANASDALNLRIAGNLSSMFPQPSGPAFVLPNELNIQPRPVSPPPQIPGALASPAMPVGSLPLAANTAAGGLSPPAPVVAPVRNQTLLPATSPAESPLPRTAEFDQLYLQEKYPQAVAAGLRLVKEGVALTQEQRLWLANALSWTGQTQQAIPYYRALFFSPFDAAARLGLANAERWRGRQELAAPVYRQVLSLAPANTDARIGLSLASRQLRPSTSLNLGRVQDNQGLIFDAFSAMHRWRNESGMRIYTVEARGVQSAVDLSPLLQAQHKSLAVRYEALDLRFAPTLNLDLQTAPDTQVFGGVRLKLGEGATYVSAGRVNWGTLNYSSRSIAARYSAAQLGLEHTSDMSLGEFSVNAQAYQVSDSNSVLSSQFRFTPAWRPLGPGFKTFAAIDTRQARFNTIDYWSPADGYGTASLGVSQAWEAADWNLFASAQVGNRLYGEGGPTWSAGLSGKRWISPDYALGFNATTLSNRRDDAAYRASFVNVNVEKLW